jgi:hypothetical protein
VVVLRPSIGSSSPSSLSGPASAIGIDASATVDFALWRWFFFGLRLVIMMILKPGGLIEAGPGAVSQ